MTINDVPEGSARKSLTKLIFNCVINISKLSSMCFINEAEIFDWTLDLIRKWLDAETIEEKLISEALDLLKFFIDLG